MPDDDLERINEVLRERPDRFAATPGNRIGRMFGRGLRGRDPETGMEDTPVLGRDEADMETRDKLLMLRRLWSGATDQRRKAIAQAAERLRASDEAWALGLFNHAVEAALILIDVEDRAARLALLSASVILPGEPTPTDGFEPVSVDLGGGFRCMVAPAVPFAEDPKGGGRRRVSFA